MSCGVVLGGAMGYRMICGGFWMGRVVKCDDCIEKEIRLENLRLKNELLKKKLKSNESISNRI